MPEEEKDVSCSVMNVCVCTVCPSAHLFNFYSPLNHETEVLQPSVWTKLKALEVFELSHFEKTLGLLISVVSQSLFHLFVHVSSMSVAAVQCFCWQCSLLFLLFS